MKKCAKNTESSRKVTLELSTNKFFNSRFKFCPSIIFFYIGTGVDTFRFPAIKCNENYYISISHKAKQNPLFHIFARTGFIVKRVSLFMNWSGFTLGLINKILC